MLYHRRLPHWHPQDKGIFLTWHLKGSLPRNRFPPPSCPTHGQAFVWLDRFLDATLSGPRWLAMQEIARLVAESIVFGQQRLQQYELGAWAVMPNHVHLLLFPHVPIPIITRRLKGYTARQANLFLRRTGEPFWQKESYDHWVSSPWIKPRFGGAAIDDGNAADEPSGPWASGVQPPADRGLPCT